MPAWNGVFRSTNSTHIEPAVSIRNFRSYPCAPHSRKNVSQYLRKQLARAGSKSFENFLVAAALLHPRLRGIQAITQYTIKRRRTGNRKASIYFVDLFYPALNLGIEINERHHAKQKQKDRNRSKVIHLAQPGYLEKVFDAWPEADLFGIADDIAAVVLRRAKEKPVRDNDAVWRGVTTFTLSQVQQLYEATAFAFDTQALGVLRRETTT